MKLYVADHGYSGAEIVFANSLEEAKEFARANDTFNDTMVFLEYEIAEGFVTSTAGDY